MSYTGIQIAGHRAFRGKYPENTLLAFNEAYNAKADIIETDLQMTSDGIIVINHDADTGRMWNKNIIISHSLMDDISKLYCKTDSNLKMLTLEDALNWLVAHPNVKLMLDTKFTNNKIILVKAFSEMLRIKNDLKYWQKRIIWGLWLVDWYEYGVETGVLKDFKFIVISLSLDIAKQFIDYSLKLNNPHYKLYGISIHFVSSWTDQFRTELLPILKLNEFKIYLWTVNKSIDFKYSCELPIEGVVTDDPIEARKLCSIYNNETRMAKERSLFTTPELNSKDGIRFHSYIKVYNFVCSILFAKWVHFNIGGWSIAYILFLFLRSIKFL
ncbi:phosphatidylglycerol phospholipase NDAI_0F01630 [Naumovozyma dairenensis CBS 421]|uniref:GP-PDE domain-containing protein n=1 Tax=Naumovozyma dairenensis (strain ATCC 10597 / BCRC 20456 / CBS 421 / NBRC 0211 / NRRL Y-12639) TaxID=1071378 RepID=G0WCH1_NAUDC|nr:hypothetical protein NDAI_0F01630 [Naumovozyma dairenensis CBS 421]CCD25482.1 hypothetical protein NDAI_0F01630 [Naumovozyma dairenensis CBS 421]